MDNKELRNLMEAYVEVYAPQEVDEGKVELDQERRSRMGRQIGKKIRSAETEYSLSKDTMYPKGLRGAMEKGARKKVGQAQKIMGALKSAQKEEFDIFDLVLEFLQAEGFAETLEEAEWMMANMIDEEAIDIILGEDSRRTSNKQHTARVRSNIKAFGSNYTPPRNYDPDANRGQGEVLTRKQIEKKRRKELRKEENENGGLDIRHISALNRKMQAFYEAQAARENPEKHEEESEKENEKKYGKVRGEKTPMPPRGDKRREEFEKWYAKQMGR